MREIISLLMFLLTVVPVPSAHGRDSSPAEPVPTEDEYRLFDQIVTSKFLTSQTTLVIIERRTATQLMPMQEGLLTMSMIQGQGYFEGALPADLVREFVAVNQSPSRLEGRFRFGVRYRFVSGNVIEEPEVSLAHPVRTGHVRPVQIFPVLDRLIFSRAAYNLRQDHALVYVGNPRPDGTGAGFLVWFRRQGTVWSLYDTEVMWTIHARPDSDGGPLLAP